MSQHTTSVHRHPAPFTAHFAPSSDPDLSVSPTSGKLSPVNSRGTLFCLTYKPTAYGRNHRGTLIVQVGIHVRTMKYYTKGKQVCCLDVSSFTMHAESTHRTECAIPTHVHVR